MIHRSATASISPIRSRPRGWPLTATAREQLDAELVRLTSEVARLAVSGPGEANDADLHLIHLPLAQADKRLWFRWTSDMLVLRCPSTDSPRHSPLRRLHSSRTT